MHVYMFMWVQMHVRSQRLASIAFLNHFPPRIFESGLSLTLELTDSAGLAELILASEL